MFRIGVWSDRMEMEIGASEVGDGPDGLFNWLERFLHGEGFEIYCMW